jgi:hypothetical protein
MPASVPLNEAKKAQSIPQSRRQLQKLGKGAFIIDQLTSLSIAKDMAHLIIL